MSAESKTLTHWKRGFNKEYLGTWSLPNGKDFTVTIEKIVERVEIKGEGGRIDIRPVAKFKEFKEPMVLNVTNCKTISKLFNTPFIEEWNGRQIILYADMNVQVGKGRNAETTEGLRVRPMLPPSAKEQEIKELSAEIRVLLAHYKGADLETIKTELNTKAAAKEATADYLKSVITKLRP
jgi:hypothetical protein